MREEGKRCYAALLGLYRLKTRQGRTKVALALSGDKRVPLYIGQFCEALEGQAQVGRVICASFCISRKGLVIVAHINSD